MNPYYGKKLLTTDKIKTNFLQRSEQEYLFKM